MSKERLAAFSDGVFAIIITIMVLELKPPHGNDWAALFKLWPTFLSYVVSFVFVGIYWNNHHHLLMAAKRVTGGILWLNLLLLFWLSLLPFATAWADETLFASTPDIIYGVILLGAALAYYGLQTAILNLQAPGSLVRRAFDKDWKGKASLAIYAFAISIAYFQPWAACALYVVDAIMWVIPDQRIERLFQAIE